MEILQELITTSETGASFSIGLALLYAAAAGIFGLCAAFTYMKTGKVSTNFARTLVILPILVCVVMLMVNGNLGTSIAIVGAFSLIRFRSLQGNSRDIAYVFFSMAIGLVCSGGYLLFALVVTILVCAVLLIMNSVHFAESKTETKDLRITIPENLDYSGLFDDLFDKYTKSAKLIRTKTTNLGSLFELRYTIELKDDTKEKEFIDELRLRNGNLTIVCGKTELNPEEL